MEAQFFHDLDTAFSKKVSWKAFQSWTKTILQPAYNDLVDKLNELTDATKKQAEEIRLLQERLGATSKQDSEPPVRDC